MIKYAKLNSNRAERFRIITTIETSEDRTFVRKRAENPLAKRHLRNLETNYKSLQGKLGVIRLVEPKFQDGSLVFDFIRGRTFLDEFNEAYIDKGEKEVQRIIEDFKALLDKLPTQLVSNTDERLVKNFGKFPEEKVRCLSTTCLDFNMDNLSRKDKEIYLFDYEWVTKDPIPLEFIFFRSLFYSFMNVGAVVAFKTSTNYPVVEIIPEMLVPKKIYDNYFPKLKDLRSYFRFEEKFQTEISGQTKKRFKDLDKPKVLSSYPHFSVFNEIDGLRSQVREIEEIRQKLKEQTAVVNKLSLAQSELNSIKISRTWKLAKALKNFKNSLESFFH